MCPRDTALSMEVRLPGRRREGAVSLTRPRAHRAPPPAPPSRSDQGTGRGIRTQSSSPADIEVCCKAHVFLLFTHQCAAGAFRTSSSDGTSQSLQAGSPHSAEQNEAARPVSTVGSPPGREDGASRDLPLRSHLTLTVSPSLNHLAGNAMHFQKLK